MAGCVILAVLPNAQNMYAQWDLGQNSIRGATELTTTTPSGEKISSGLDKDYAFAWSYGKGELLTLLVPNAYGGSSGLFRGIGLLLVCSGNVRDPESDEMVVIRRFCLFDIAGIGT